MSDDMLNVEIEKFIEENGNALRINFTVSNNINIFISFHNLMREHCAVYDFIISNMGWSDKAGMH